MAEIYDTCLWCGARVEQPSRGPRRRYCSARCRKRSERFRRAADFQLKVPGEVLGSVPAERVIAAAVREARSAAVAMAAAAPFAPDLAARAERAAMAIREALERDLGDLL